jgi:8-oxo-dGTP pyrophosphatase MutT (NUDIX family)
LRERETAIATTGKKPIKGSNRKMVREFSAGALVLRQMQNRWWVAVIEPGRDGEPEDRKDLVALPKGNIDEGEKPVEAAVREVSEETGLTSRPVTKLADIKYVYNRKWSDNAKIFKVVSFYLMKYQSGQIDDVKPNMRHEVRRAYWLPLDDAAKHLSYSGEKDVARQALEYLKAHPEES